MFVRLILFLFNAVWTVAFSTAYMLWIVDGAVHLLASIASSVIWLLISSVLWVRRVRTCCRLISDFSRTIASLRQIGYCCRRHAQHTLRWQLRACASHFTVCVLCFRLLCAQDSTRYLALESTYLGSKAHLSHRCRQSLTVEALGWTEFGLCLITMVRRIRLPASRFPFE